MSLIIDRMVEAERAGQPVVRFTEIEWSRDIAFWKAAGTAKWLWDTWLSRNEFGADAEVFYLVETMDVVVFRHDIARAIARHGSEATL